MRAAVLTVSPKTRYLRSQMRGSKNKVNYNILEGLTGGVGRQLDSSSQRRTAAA